MLLWCDGCRVGLLVTRMVGIRVSFRVVGVAVVGLRVAVTDGAFEAGVRVGSAVGCDVGEELGPPVDCAEVL